MRWWDRDTRIAWELEELTRAGYRFEPPADTTGAFTLVVYADINGDEQRLEATFPLHYPYFRFEVRAPGLALPHHQHPFGKNLCLLPRRTHYWRTAYSLAQLLTEQLPKTVSAGLAMDTETVAAVQEHQAEPVTDYYHSLSRPGATILVDADVTLPSDFRAGRMFVRVDKREQPGQPLRGVVTQIDTLDGTVVYTEPKHLKAHGPTLHGQIVKLATPVLDDDATHLQYELRGKYLRNERSKGTSILAVVMPEEHAWRNETGQGWLFIIGERGEPYYFARAGRAGAKALYERAPDLDGLREQKIAVFGLGCVGGVSAVELAKAGVGELRVADPDIVDPETVLRWYLGLPIAGRHKAEIITSFVGAHYPLTNVKGFAYRVGSVDSDPHIEPLTDRVTLIYDATAEDGVAYFLSDLARAKGVPYLHVSATQGGWGGMIVRLTEQTGCWYCFQAAQASGRIPGAAADARGTLQPAGCGDPTFTGANFDLASIALAGVRTAISTVAPRYPAQPWDVMIISLRDEHGALIPPRYEVFPLPKDPACPACGSAGTYATN